MGKSELVWTIQNLSNELLFPLRIVSSHGCKEITETRCYHFRVGDQSAINEEGFSFETISLVRKIFFRVFQNLFGSFADSESKVFKCLFLAFRTSTLIYSTSFQNTILNYGGLHQLNGDGWIEFFCQ